ncbi:MAG: amidohydrolase family protein [Verrucomicrobiota bacterium]
MQRRTFLQSTIALSACTSPLAALAASTPAAIIDTNVYLGSHPFHSPPLENPGQLATKLRSLGITSAWAAPMESLLHRDLDRINADHAQLCQQHDLFTAIGSINPKLPDWQESLRRCHQVHRMAGIRLHPAYHGYQLDDPDFKKLLSEVSQRNLLMQIAPHMEDKRTQHPKAVVPATDPSPLLELLPNFKNLRIQIINGLRTITNKKLQTGLAALGVHFDISMLEGVAGIARCTIPAKRLCYGSYAPVFIPEAAALKVTESAPDISKQQLNALLHGNAEKLIA